MLKESRVIAIAEPKWTAGHFATQMQMFLSVLLQEGHRIIVLCPAPDQVLGWVEESMPAFRHLVYTTFFSLDRDTLAAQIKRGSFRHYITGLLRTAESSTGWQVDIVFITWLDILLDGIGRAWWFRNNLSYPWTGLYFLPTYLRIRAVGIKGLARWFSVQTAVNSPFCRSLAVLDEGVQPALAASAHGKPVLVFPDATDERLPEADLASIQEIRLRAAGRPIVGLLGVLERRKSLLTFLRAMAGTDPGACFYLVAGYLPWEAYSAAEQQELKDLMALDGGNGHFELRFIEDPVEFNAYVKVCDFLFMAYEDFYHSSGILSKAAAFEKPVIVSVGFCMDERVQRYRMGLSIPCGDAAQARAAILRLADEEFRTEIKRQGGFQNYHEFHNQEQMKKALLEMLGLSGEE